MKLTRDLFTRDNLLESLHLNDFDDDQKETLFILVMDILEIKFLDCVLAELSEEDKKEFTRLLVDESQHEAVKSFLQKKIKNLDEKLEHVISEFKKELVVDILQAKADLLKGEKDNG